MKFIKILLILNQNPNIDICNEKTLAKLQTSFYKRQIISSCKQRIYILFHLTNLLDRFLSTKERKSL